MTSNEIQHSTQSKLSSKLKQIQTTPREFSVKIIVIYWLNCHPWWKVNVLNQWFNSTIYFSLLTKQSVAAKHQAASECTPINSDCYMSKYICQTCEKHIWLTDLMQIGKFTDLQLLCKLMPAVMDVFLFFYIICLF